MYRIESLLSARLFLTPQLVGDRIYFLSNLSGHLSLYAMDPGGSVPEPLLPGHIALQNPELLGGYGFYVYPKLGKILIMIDHNGDEVYQPMVIPLTGGIPEPAFGPALDNYRVACPICDADANLAYFNAESRTEPLFTTFQANLETGTLTKLGQSRWGMFPMGVNDTHDRAIVADGYTVGDEVLYEWRAGGDTPRLLYGKPLEDRAEGEQVPLNSIVACHYTPGDTGLLFITSLFEDTYSLGYLLLEDPGTVHPVPTTGVVHTGAGEMTGLVHLKDTDYRVEYNIDGASWVYEGRFDEAKRTMHFARVLCGEGDLVNGVLESIRYDKEGDRFGLSFSTATSPTQLYTVEGADRQQVTRHTREQVLGIPQEALSPGEDASFTSWDGQRVSARMYLPAPSLGFQGARPLVYYIHGGPQGQERPNFAWFSMPLIQFLTLNGFAVFVPNARGSTGYGLSYTKLVDHDWGGDDRLDHVHAMTKVLPQDSRVDTKRAGVVGRSYGGYMTLTQATRHPDLWAAAVDMFGPYELLKFVERVPETWKAYFAIAIGDPVKDRDFLIERSPQTYIEQITCPLLVIQGKNDPRVTEIESRELVEHLRGEGKEVDYLMFEDEGHDVLKFPNRVRCYNAITDFFAAHLHP